LEGGVWRASGVGSQAATGGDRQLNHLVAELTLDNRALKPVLSRKWQAQR